MGLIVVPLQESRRSRRVGMCLGGNARVRDSASSCYCSSSYDTGVLTTNHELNIKRFGYREHFFLNAFRIHGVVVTQSLFGTPGFGSRLFLLPGVGSGIPGPCFSCWNKPEAAAAVLLASLNRDAGSRTTFKH